EGLDSTQVATLEQKLQAGSEDRATCTKLIGYYYAHKSHSETARQAYRNYLKWFIRNHPEMEVTGSPVAFVAITDSAFYREIKKLWLAQTEKYPDNIAVIGNAAEFFSHANAQIRISFQRMRVDVHKLDDGEAIVPELEIAESLLKKARTLEPNNRKWPERLARVYGTLKNLVPPENKHTYAKKALDILEKRLKQDREGGKKYVEYQRLALAAFDAQEWQKAEMYAQKNLANAEEYKDDRSYGRAVHQGNELLGRLSLRSGDVDAAKTFLLAAGETPGTKFDGIAPRLILAKDLLAKGEKETVIKYLQLSKNIWKQGTDRLNSWMATIEAGGIPDFDMNIQNTNTAIFTTGLSERDLPVDNIEQIPITRDRVYVYTYWNGLTDEEHSYLCKIYDGDGRNVSENSMKITPRRGHWRTWTWYYFNERQDAPGDWRFEIFLDGKLTIEKTLVVLDRSGRRYDPARIDNLLQKSRVLAQSLAKYKSLTGYRDSIIVENRTVQPWMDNRRFTRIRFAFQSPNRALIESESSPGHETIFVSDGDSTFNYFSLWNQYQKRKSLGKLPKHSINIPFSPGIFLVSMLFSRNPIREVLWSVEDVAKIGHEQINGQSVTVVALTQPFESLQFGMQLPQNSLQKPIKLHLWIGDDDFLIRKVAYEYEERQASLRNLPERQRAMMEGMKRTLRLR
ncbi:MAG: tetratricopeptide repeat protein, partial [bacterium]